MHVRLNAPDIACKSCVNAITNALMKVDGVQQVSVDIATKTVEVQFEENRVTMDAILHRLDAAGFPAQVIGSAN
ncbi:MAG: heavy-metal-associated domain-containing protein [Firmicutes bacterium]|nr:heavy-metal-associated domain-containing protein [Bacillota bacterium]